MCSQRTGPCIHSECCYKVRVMAEIGGVQEAECTNLHQFELAGRGGLNCTLSHNITYRFTLSPLCVFLLLVTVDSTRRLGSAV